MRDYTKVCRRYHTFFEGFQVPKGAIYGRIHTSEGEIFWVCDCPKMIKQSYIHVHIMKRTWNSNQDIPVSKMVWNKTALPKSHQISKNIRTACKELGGIPRVTTYSDPNQRIKIDRRALDLPYDRRVPLPQQPQWYERPLGYDNPDCKGPVINPYCWAVTFKNEPQVKYKRQGKPVKS